MPLHWPSEVRAARQRRLERLKAGRFYSVTCERGHTTQMSGIDLCRNADTFCEKVLCPECYERVKITQITDGPLMNEEQKKKQQEEYMVWLKEQEREKKRQEDIFWLQEAASESGIY
jgi:hypothetical protein